MNSLLLSISFLLLSLAQSQTVEDIFKQRSCGTAALAGLSSQIVQQINVLRPGLFTDLRTLKGISLSSGAATVPYLQTAAALKLQRAINARQSTMSINSALRTLPQQFLLRKWFENNQCGFPDAAIPGRSNHNGGVAIDIENARSWDNALRAESWIPLAGDPPHFDFKGTGADGNVAYLSVLAFQQLWNQNNPSQKIAEDGIYTPGGETANAILRSPASGFSKSSKTAVQKTTTTRPATAGGGIDATQFSCMFPNVASARVREYLPLLNSMLSRYQINTRARMMMFLAQTGHETDYYNTFEEYMNGNTWCKEYNGGCTFRGRGAIQLTHRYNYLAAGKDLKQDFVANPDMVEQPRWAFEVSGWFWKKNSLNTCSDQGNVQACTRIISGSSTSAIDSRLKLYEKAKKCVTANSVSARASAEEDTVLDNTSDQQTAVAVPSAVIIACAVLGVVAFVGIVVFIVVRVKKCQTERAMEIVP